jgi:hypothetical protein
LQSTNEELTTSKEEMQSPKWRVADCKCGTSK